MRWPFGKRHDRALFNVGDAYPVPSTYADVSRFQTPEAAMRLSSVWACVRLLADTVSTLPVDVFREGSRDPLPTPTLLRQPASGWATHEWLYAAMVSLLLRGNAWGLITARSGAAMRPAQVELLHPDLVAVRVLENGTIEHRYKGAEVDPDDLWHVRAFPFPGSPTGLSPVDYARHTIGLGLAGVRFGNQFYEEGAAPTGMLTSDHVVTGEQAKTAKEAVARAVRGSRVPLVLGQGMTWQQIAVSPTDAQWIEQQRFTVSDVARVFGVPPEMVGGEAGNSLTYGNVEGRALDFLRYSVNPWLVRLETALARLLPRGQTVKFNAGGLLRSTTQERYAAYSVALDKGFLTLDEVRHLEDRPPLPGGAVA